MATLFVDKIDPQSGTTLSLGSSGDTLQATAGTTNNLGISMTDHWRLTASTNQNTDADVTSNWERVDEASYGSIGTGLTESSGIFSFAQTGIYFINYFCEIYVHAGDTSADFELQTTTNNSTYNKAGRIRTGNATSTNRGQNGSSSYIIDVTNTSNVKFKFVTFSFGGSSTNLTGSTSETRTGFVVIRLGDT